MIKREEIKYKVGHAKKDSGAQFLVYIDARIARRELNEKFRFGNWQFTYTENSDKSVHGVLKVLSNDIWLEFHDAGYCDNDHSKEPLKDAVSDATKRCAVQVGVGEFLYDAPFIWIKKDMIIWNNDKFKKLTDEGKAIVESQIDKWYEKLPQDEKETNVVETRLQELREINKNKL